jgi:hypothetical protein
MSFAEAPVSFVSIQTHNGGNTAGIRMKDCSADSCMVMIEEE